MQIRRAREHSRNREALHTYAEQNSRVRRHRGTTHVVTFELRLQGEWKRGLPRIQVEDTSRLADAECLDGTRGRDQRNSSRTVEAEVAFLCRQESGQWPEYQHEIHFYPSVKRHRTAAKTVYERATREA